jgi:hypothetical protein
VYQVKRRDGWKDRRVVEEEIGCVENGSRETSGHPVLKECS